ALQETAPVALLRHAIREAHELGAQFRISGADVVVDNFNVLPVRLRAALGINTSYLWALIDNGQDSEPQRLLAEPGVRAELVQTPGEARAGVRRIMQAAAVHGGPIGFDMRPRPSQSMPSLARMLASTRMAATRTGSRPRRITRILQGSIRIAPTSCSRSSIP